MNYEYEVDTKGLRKAMIEKGMTTCEDLSLASGVNRNTTSDVVNGRAYPSSSVMKRMGGALELTSAEMADIFFKVKLARDASN